MKDEQRVIRAKALIGGVLRRKYRLDALLGVGGSATVYGATHLRNGDRVAVKILHAELSSDTEVRERFLREGYTANKVNHRGTVRVLDDDTAEDGTVFLVMDLLEGETLDARCARRGQRLEAAEVARFVHELLDVLAAAHDKGIVHRDIKPENLFLTREGTLKVLDFGVARLLEGSVTATRSGGVLGTPAFMAPEQVLGKNREVDAQSDLWSVGATAFTLVSGRYVHEAETPQEMMVFAASRQACSLASVAPTLPAELADVFDRALKLEKSERWPDARAMQSALADAYRSTFGVAPTESRIADFARDGAGTPNPDLSSLDSETGERPSTTSGVTAKGSGEELRWLRSAHRRVSLLVGLAVIAALTGGGLAATWIRDHRSSASRGAPATGSAEVSREPLSGSAELAGVERLAPPVGPSSSSSTSAKASSWKRPQGLPSSVAPPPGQRPTLPAAPCFACAQDVASDRTGVAAAASASRALARLRESLSDNEDRGEGHESEPEPDPGPASNRAPPARELTGGGTATDAAAPRPAVETLQL